MAEVLGFVEVAVCITEVVEKLYGYITSVKEAKDDIRRLSQEMFALKGAIEHFDLQNKSDLGVPQHDQTQHILKVTHETMAVMQKRLSRPATSFGRAMQKLTWPFKSGEVEKYLATIERSKTWFVMMIMRESTGTTTAIYEEVQRLSAAVQADIVTRQAELEARETSDLLKWLSPVDSQEELQNSTKDKVVGTGLWIWDPRTAAWAEGDLTTTPFIWICGKTGSGKTVLFSTIVEELQSRCTSDKALRRAAAFHCCSLDNAASQPVANVFGSILAQIGALHPQLLDHIRPLRLSGKALIPHNNLSIAQIHQLMGHALKLLDTLYLMVDALNETPHEAQIVTTLLSLTEKHQNLRVLATCTKPPPEPSPKIGVLDMNSKVIDLDIEAFVNFSLATEPSLKSLSETIRAEIRDKIVSDAHGSFRWARLCMDRLSSLRTGRDMRRALADMPSTLNETYTRIIARIPEADKSLARDSLLWLCFSLRPLTLPELAEAVILDDLDTHIDADYRITNPAVLLDICAGLIHAHRDSVTLAHDSLRSFLQSDWIRSSPVSSFFLDPADCHRKIMKKCIAYLRLEPFRLGPVTTLWDLRRRVAGYPLIPYASILWPIHAERFALSPSDESLILGFFATKAQDANGGAFNSWVQFLLEDVDMGAINITEPLYYAASFNMVPIVRLLVRPEHKIDIDKRGGRYRSTPLYVALWRDNYEAARILVEAGADVDAEDYSTGDSCRSLARWRPKARSLVPLMEEMKPSFGRGGKYGISEALAMRFREANISKSDDS